MIAVADSGIGVASEDMKNLFERFEQFDERSQTKIGSGTGLGLAIVSKISKLLGAKIHVESNLGEGSRFSLNLPKHYQPVDSRVSNFPDHH
jgi:signal transduction histidine kinase